MHIPVFITFDSNKASSNYDARQYVRKFFEDKYEFQYEQGHYINYPGIPTMSDYLIVGGRFTSLLPGNTSATDKTCWERLGQEQDATILTKELYQQFLSPHEGQSHHVPKELDKEFHFTDLDGEPITTEFIGNKWIVICDTHN